LEFRKKKQLNFNSEKIKKIAKNYDLDINVVKLLFMRGYNTAEKIENFLYPSKESFHNPMLLKNMDKLIEKINFHIERKSRIVILGDYDTDGISASAIIYKLFNELGVKPNVFLPNRIADGYGLSMETIDKIKTLYSPDFIITVDCGI